MKIKIFIISALGIFFITANSLAAACSWEIVTVSSMPSISGGGTSQTGGCEPKGLATSPGTNCQSLAKPKHSAALGQSLVCCCPKKAVAPKNTLFKAPDIQIEIPGMEKLSDINCAEGESCEIPWLGQYIRGIYNYAIAVAGILAALVLMAGGVLWLLSRGEASKITKAKELIIGSVVGLVILTGSYLLLTIINPNLVNLQNIKIANLKSHSLGGDSTDSSALVSMDTAEIAKKLNITCGKDSVSEIVTKSKGKISYSQSLKTKVSADGFVNFDCSSYAYFLLKCAKGVNPDSYTGAIFKNQAIWNKDTSWLRPGDLIGWAPQNNPRNEGHVLIYIGNNQFADCHSTKKAGECIGNLSAEKVLGYATSHSNGNLYYKRY